MRSTLFAAILTLAACGGSTHVTGDQLCDDICARQTSCGGDGTCDPKCPAQAELVRPDAIDALDDCYLTLACSDSDDTCLQKAEDAVGDRATDTQFRADCTAARDACDDSFGDDLCFESFLYSDDVVTDLEACLVLPCDQVNDCLNTATAR